MNKELYGKCPGPALLIKLRMPTWFAVWAIYGCVLLTLGLLWYYVYYVYLCICVKMILCDIMCICLGTNSLFASNQSLKENFFSFYGLKIVFVWVNVTARGELSLHWLFLFPIFWYIILVKQLYNLFFFFF